MMGFRDAVASAGPHANNLHLQSDSSTSSLDFYWPDALPDSKLTVLKHWRQIVRTGI